MKAGVHDYCLKVTEGIDFLDEMYAANRKTILAEGGRISGYHFARPRKSGGKAQAQFFLAHANLTPGTHNKMMLDLEDNGGLNKHDLTVWVGDFTKEIDRVLGPGHYVYTLFDLEKSFGWKLWVARYHPSNALPRVCAPWPMWDVRQFSNGVVGNPHTVAGFSKVDLNNVVGPLEALRMPKRGGAKPKPVPVKVPATPKNAVDFRVHLVPGNKAESVAAIGGDMALVKKVSGSSAVVFNTERQEAEQRKQVQAALGTGWTTYGNTENVISSGPSWKIPAGMKTTSLLLNPKDPHLAGVSPNRYIQTVPQTHKALPDVTVKMKGLHLLSEANCIHIHVKGRAWREKNYPLQIADLLDDIEKDHKAGIPQVIAGDFNTGKFFTGKQLFAKLQKRFGKDVVHVHNGGLDHIFLVSAGNVRLTEQGVEKLTNNASDHDMVTATVRAQLVK